MADEKLIDHDPNQKNWITLTFKVHITDYTKLIDEYNRMGEELGDNNKEYPFERYLRESLMNDIDAKDNHFNLDTVDEKIMNIIRKNPGITPRQLYDMYNDGK
jgi:hypothetical protein